jgi:hypothetical protein
MRRNDENCIRFYDYRVNTIEIIICGAFACFETLPAPGTWSEFSINKFDDFDPDIVSF